MRRTTPLGCEAALFGRSETAIESDMFGKIGRENAWSAATEELESLWPA